jgi:hydrogenase maturation protease
MTLSAEPRPRVPVAGVGNVFLGDDGFGVEVARRPVDETPPGCPGRGLRHPGRPPGL